MAWPTVVVDTTNMDAVGDNPGNARAAIKQMADNVNAIKDSKGAASGVAELDAGGKVPLAQIPVVTAVKGGTGQSTFTIGDVFYADTATTLAKLAAGAIGTVLTSGGAGVAPSYQAAAAVSFSAGTRMTFNQTAAPTGWTKDTTAALNDSIMRIVTGAVASGGSTAFSAWSAANNSVGATTLTTAQIPSHSHTKSINSGGSLGSSQTWGSSTVSNTPVITDMGLAGGGSGGSHTHTGIGAPTLKYYDFIIASKD